MKSFVRTIPQSKHGRLKYGEVPDHWTELEHLGNGTFSAKEYLIMILRTMLAY
jgi:hypothetical protein